MGLHPVKICLPFANMLTEYGFRLVASVYWPNDGTALSTVLGINLFTKVLICEPEKANNRAPTRKSPYNGISTRFGLQTYKQGQRSKTPVQ
jgi:hypothetical protein